MGKLINKIQDSSLLIHFYQARLQERMLNRSASLAMSTSVLEALSGKLDIKRHSLSILYILANSADSDGILHSAS